MDRERPEFGGFVENMNDTSAEPNVTTLGVRLQIPFAYDPVNQPKRAAAAAEVVAAAEELALAEREVAGDVDQAQVRLDGARQQLAALEARATVVQLARDSQRAGQVALSELIRALATRRGRSCPRDCPRSRRARPLGQKSSTRPRTVNAPRCRGGLA